MMRSYIPFDRVLTALRQYPDGITSTELAETLGMQRSAVSSQLSKAFMHGRGVDRTQRPRAGRCQFIWRAA